MIASECLSIPRYHIELTRIKSWVNTFIVPLSITLVYEHTDVAYQSAVEIVLERAQCGGIVEPIYRGVVRYISRRIDERLEQLL